MTYKEAAEIIRINLEGLMASPKVTLDPRLIEAERMGIKALEEMEEDDGK